MNTRFAHFNLINACIAWLRLDLVLFFHKDKKKKIQETQIAQNKKVLLTGTLTVCSCQRFQEVGGAILFQTGTYTFDENLV